MRSFYDGLGAGCLRQVFYATSRFGLFETFRDAIAERRRVGPAERVAAGLASGACAALLSCPAEVALVRSSNGATLPAAERRNYRGPADAALRILRDEGVAAFWRGSAPFVQRAMLVGVTQVGTLDQAKQFYDERAGVPRGTYGNVFCASMTSGLVYSLVTMPFETAKNLMAFQKPDARGALAYRATGQTILAVARSRGVLTLPRNKFPPTTSACGRRPHVPCSSSSMRRHRAPGGKQEGRGLILPARSRGECHWAVYRLGRDFWAWLSMEVATAPRRPLSWDRGPSPPVLQVVLCRPAPKFNGGTAARSHNRTPPRDLHSQGNQMRTVHWVSPAPKCSDELVG